MIAPLVKVAGIRSYVKRAAIAAISMIAAAVLMGVAFGTVGSLMGGEQRTWAAVLALVTAAYALNEFGVIRLPLLSRDWQVPRDWGRFGSIRSIALFGFVLGTGFLTRAPFSSYPIMVGSQVVFGTIVFGAVSGLCFGVGRSASLLLGPLLEHSFFHGRPLAMALWVDNQELRLHIANGLVLATLAGALIPGVMN